LVVGLYNNEVGVFEKTVKDVAGGLFFVHGKVYLSIHYMDSRGQTSWSELNNSSSGASTIDRPKTFNVSGGA
jgi:hypothetical protein